MIMSGKYKSKFNELNKVLQILLFYLDNAIFEFISLLL